MKKTFTQKLSCLALGALLLSPQLKATEPVKVDYTDLLRNPSFDYVLDGNGNQVAPSKENNLAINALNDWYRFCPYGWTHKVVYNGTEIPWNVNDNNTTDAILKNSYGVNNDVQAKTVEGSYLLWMKSDKPLDLYELYQEIPVGNGVGQIPPGEYIVSCRLAVMGNNNTDRRFTTQRIFASTATQNLVQYFGSATDYDKNLTTGEVATFANWISDDTGTGSSIYLRPVSVTITVSEGETLKIGIKTSNKGKDGFAQTGTDVGWFKLDAFHITKKYTAADDYTSSIVNNNFELKGVLNPQTNLIEAIPIGGASTASLRFAPYGWNHQVVKDYTDGVPNILPWTATQNNAAGSETTGGAAFLQSVGCNVGDHKIMLIREREYFSFWAGITGMPEYTLYQDVAGLQSGTYRVSCYMYVPADRFRTQRLFANNKVQFFGQVTDYDLDKQLTLEEKTKLAAGQLTVSYANYVGGGEFQPMSLDVNVQSGESLRLGVKTSGVDKLGVTGTDNSGIVRVDYFRLQRISDITTTVNNVENTGFSVIGQKNGFFLNMDKATLANVKVLSLSGQTVYASQVNSTNTWITLPQGLYIIQVSANGMNKAAKVLVK